MPPLDGFQSRARNLPRLIVMLRAKLTALVLSVAFFAVWFYLHKADVSVRLTGNISKAIKLMVFRVYRR